MQLDCSTLTYSIIIFLKNKAEIQTSTATARCMEYIRSHHFIRSATVQQNSGLEFTDPHIYTR
jgi:hypothetical protein